MEVYASVSGPGSLKDGASFFEVPDARLGEDVDFGDWRQVVVFQHVQPMLRSRP